MRRISWLWVDISCTERTALHVNNNNNNNKIKLIALQARCGPEGGYSYSSTLPWPRHYKGVSGQQHAPAALYPRERLGTHFTGGWWTPGPDWTGGKSRPHRDSIPDRSARSQSLYRQSYPAHNISINILLKGDDDDDDNNNNKRKHPWQISRDSHNLKWNWLSICSLNSAILPCGLIKMTPHSGRIVPLRIRSRMLSIHRTRFQ